MKLLFLSFMVWACTQPQSPTSVEPAAKALIDPFSSAVEWSCGTDSVWSVFNGNFSFNIDGEDILVRERAPLEKNKIYHDHKSSILYEDGRCVLVSEFISADSVTRIFKGRIWRDSIYRLYLVDDSNDGLYRLNKRYITSDGEYRPLFEMIYYRDFNDHWNQDEPRPISGLTRLDELGYRRYFRLYYLPVNFSQAALDTLKIMPKDDRPYLIDPIVEVEVEPVVEEEAVKKPRASRDRSSSSSGSGSGGSGGGSSGGGTTSSGIQGGGNNTGSGDVGNDQPLSGDASLSSLNVSAGSKSISFSSSTLSYLFSVGNDVSSVSVSAEANHPRASFVVSLNETTISGSGSLNEGSNSLVVKVTAENGNTRSYTVTIVRAGSATPPTTPVFTPITIPGDTPDCDSDKTNWAHWDTPCSSDICGITEIQGCFVSGTPDNTGVTATVSKTSIPHTTGDPNSSYHRHIVALTFSRSGSTDREQTFRFKLELTNFSWHGCKESSIPWSDNKYATTKKGKFRKGGSLFFTYLVVCGRDPMFDTETPNFPTWTSAVSIE